MSYDQMRTNKAIKEVRRFLKFVTEDFREDVKWNFLNELYIFNVYYMESSVSTNLSTASRPEVQTVTKTIEKLAKSLNIDANMIRINAKVLLKGELSIVKVNNKTQHIPFEDIEKLSKNTHYLNAPRHYPFATESFDIFILNSAQKINTLVKQEGELYDFVQDEDYAFLINNNNQTNFQEKALLSLLKHFKLNYLDRISKSLTNIDIKVTPALAIQLYHHERKNFLLRHIAHQLDNLKYLLNDYELIIKENASAQLQEVYETLQKLVKSGEIDSGALNQIAKKLEVFNYGYEKEFAHRDTFPVDYMVGVYVPLIFPLVYPLVKALVFQFKKYKEKIKEAKIKLD